MIQSMTAFARAEEENGNKKCVVELRSVNHRFLDINVRIPSKDFSLEKKIKDLIGEKITRGSIEVALTFSDTEAPQKNLVVDEVMVKQYLDAAHIITTKFPVYGEVDLLSLLNQKDIFKYEEEEIDLAKRWDLMKKTLEKALKLLVTMRGTEGKNLEKDILEKLKAIEISGKEIAKAKEKKGASAAERIKAKIKEMFADAKIDDQRIVTEAALIAERSDIAEEITRLASHLSQIRTELKGGSPVGRKLDFLVQELNRETNTIGSKSSLYEISHQVVEMKSNIEKIREQAANIE